VREVGENIVFLRRLVAGGADRSYGVEVARLAGLPGAVVARAPADPASWRRAGRGAVAASRRARAAAAARPLRRRRIGAGRPSAEGGRRHPDAAPGALAARRHRQPYADVLGTVGWTPLIRLNRLAAGIRTPVYGKAEFMNPGGSVKDRIGPAIIEAAEREGRLRPGGTVVEGTSGNTGVGLASRRPSRGTAASSPSPTR
jgi:hypothetical protein